MKRSTERAARALTAIDPEHVHPDQRDRFTAATRVLAADLAEIDRRAERRRDAAVERKATAPTRPAPKNRKPDPVSAEHQRARLRRRLDVRRGRLIANPGCEGPERGLPGVCGTIGHRRKWEIHEIVGRGRSGSTAQYVLALTTTLCPVHHDYCTSAAGAQLGIVKAAGLIVPSSALLPSVKDHALGLRLPLGLKPEWRWARPDGAWVQP